jgi:DNA-binding XRE family transcriptional regulator
LLSGHKIKSYREKLGVCQEFIANELKVSQATFSRIESGKVKAKHRHLHVLAKIFQVGPGDLLDDE